MERRTTQESLVDLADSGQFLSAEEIISERRTDDPMEMVVRSEVAVYFDRLEDGASLLEQVAPRIAEIDVAARYSIALGRLATYLKDFDKAAIHLQTGYHFYLFLDDSFGISRSLLALAHLSLCRNQLDDAAMKLESAHEGLKGRATKKVEFLRGLITAEQASVAAERGKADLAAQLYSDATRLLKGTERGRCYARALVGIGGLKCALGEFQESLELFKEASAVFERYDVKRELAETQLKLAEALLRLKRYDRAEKLAEDSRDLLRGNSSAESVALALLSLVALEKNELDEADSRANAALAAADQNGSLTARARARIAVGHVKLAEREFKQATEVLEEAARLARDAKDSLGNTRLELESIIYLAEAYHAVDTRAGRAELARASEILNSLDDAWLGDEFNRVSGKYEEQIIFTDDNRLVFDGNQLPRWQEAKRTLEGFLLRNALRQTNNSLTRAARKLGVSKVHVHNLKKKHSL